MVNPTNFNGLQRWWNAEKYGITTHWYALPLYVCETHYSITKRDTNVVSMQVVIFEIGNLTWTNKQWNRTRPSGSPALVFVQWAKVKFTVIVRCCWYFWNPWGSDVCDILTGSVHWVLNSELGPMLGWTKLPNLYCTWRNTDCWEKGNDPQNV